MHTDPLELEVEKREQFWKTFCVVLIVHAAVVAGVVSVSRWLFKPRVVEQITWLDAGATSGAEEAVASEPPTEPTPPEPQSPTPQPQTPSDFPEATPTPKPTPKPTPRPTTPKPKETPTPLKNFSKTTPRPTPRNPIVTRPNVPKLGTGVSGTNPQNGPKTGSGAAGGTGTNAAIAADMNRYRELVEVRFGSLWEQPVVGVDAGGGIQIGLIHFRVAADGSATSVKLSKSSGSSVMDQSLESLCKRITALPPPPASIQVGGFFEGSIEMRLSR